MTRPESDRDGPCVCDYNPETMDGPSEDCPFHGRPYRYWIERGDALQQRVDRVAALAASMAEDSPLGLSVAQSIRDALNPEEDE